MAEETQKRKINFKKIALFGLGPLASLGLMGLGLIYLCPLKHL